jgi:CheY-like chemotaxis protein
MPKAIMRAPQPAAALWFGGTRAEARAETMARSDHVSQPSDSTRIAGARVLVVEDEEDARDLLITLLEECGMEVRSAPSVAAGMEEFRGFRPEVVLSDIGMPVEDGYSLARRIRSLPTADGGDTPMLALTAFAGNDDRERARAAGFNAHLAKPVEPAELLDVLGTVLAGVRG